MQVAEPETEHLVAGTQVQPMMRSGGGAIVLVSSSVAYHGYAAHEATAAAKGAVNGLALSAASTYAPHNIRVNVCSPGLVCALHSLVQCMRASVIAGTCAAALLAPAVETCNLFWPYHVYPSTLDDVENGRQTWVCVFTAVRMHWTRLG